MEILEAEFSPKGGKPSAGLLLAQNLLRSGARSVQFPLHASDEQLWPFLRCINYFRSLGFHWVHWGSY